MVVYSICPDFIMSLRTPFCLVKRPSCWIGLHNLTMEQNLSAELVYVCWFISMFWNPGSIPSGYLTVCYTIRKSGKTSWIICFYGPTIPYSYWSTTFVLNTNLIPHYATIFFATSPCCVGLRFHIFHPCADNHHPSEVAMNLETSIYRMVISLLKAHHIISLYYVCTVYIYDICPYIIPI